LECSHGSNGYIIADTILECARGIVTITSAIDIADAVVCSIADTILKCTRGAITNTAAIDAAVVVNFTTAARLTTAIVTTVVETLVSVGATEVADAFAGAAITTIPRTGLRVEYFIAKPVADPLYVQRSGATWQRYWVPAVE
jgi:hypothetical protein